MPLEPGTRLGPYDLQSRLGGGGMGEVWKAYDPKLQRTVAIKVLHETDDAASRILAEARAASALNHNHICTIYDVGEAEGQSFIVMEHVDGKPLSGLIPSDGLPPESVIRYGTQIADALAHAHEHGIVHRDLKSDNVVITPEAQVKLIDFGIAVPLPRPETDAMTRTLESPVSSAPVGTLAYMAPEVLRGEAATARSDIWSLGVLLYEMASGRLPFEGETPLDVVSAITKETPRALPSRVSAGLRSVVQRCLQKEPGSRYSSPAVVQGALEMIQSATAVALPPGLVSAKSSRDWRAAAVVLLVAVLAAGYWLRPAPHTSLAGTLRLADPVQVTSGSGLVESLAWSPDGDMIAYYSNNGDVWITPLGGQPLNRTADYDWRGAGSPNRTRPTWSPDGQQIAFSNTDGISLMPALAGMPRSVTANGRDPHWLNQGSELAYTLLDADRRSFIEILTLGSGETRRLAVTTTETDTVQDLRWSPDEQYLAYVATQNVLSEVWLMNSSGDDAVRVTEGRAYSASPSWSPDGRTLYYVSNRQGSRDLWQQRVLATGRPEGEPTRVTLGIGMWRAALSPDGTRLAYVQGGRAANVWRVPVFADRPATWADAEQVTFDRALTQGVDVSKDGTRLVISSDRNGNFDLWTLPATGGEAQQLTTDLAPDWIPRWSPDGRMVAFFSYRSGNRDIWVAPADGGTPQQLTTSELNEMFPTWSPDGTEIAYSVQEEREVKVVSLETGESRHLADDAGSPAWSPDGAWLAFVSRGQIVRVPVAGGDRERLVLGSHPFWSADGRELYYSTTAQDSSHTFRSLRLDDRSERELTDLRGKAGSTGAFAYSTDGEYLYFVWREDQGDIWVMDVVQDEE